MRDILTIADRIVSVGYSEIHDDYSLEFYGPRQAMRSVNGYLRSQYRFRLGRRDIDGRFYLCPAIFWCPYGWKEKAIGIRLSADRWGIWRWR